MDYLKLKSGTDVRGIAAEGVEGEHIQLTDEVICTITDAFLFWLCETENTDPRSLKIAVGHDSRISAARIKDCVIKTLSGRGVRVVDCSMASTPAMFMTTVMLGANAAVQITASHHPFNRNGLKFFTKGGGLGGGDITKVLTYAQNARHTEGVGGSVEQYDFMSDYSAHLRSIIIDGTGEDEPLAGFKIAVDAGNGAGGFYAYDVLEPLGADISGSRYLEPDGMFPNHIPNPENEQAMASVCEAVVESGSDLGVIFDTDVDRGGCVDSHGREINRNRLVALAAAIALEDCPGGTIVTDSVTSSGLKDFIENTLGGSHYRFKRGYKNVIDESVRLNDEGVRSPLAIETSGHAAFSENYFLDDGAYLVTKIIIKAVKLRREGRSIEDLTAALKEPAEAQELRFKIKKENFREYGEGVICALHRYAQEHGWDIAPDNREGLRVSFGHGWFLLRLSVHDPIMPLNIESDEKGGVLKIAGELYGFLRTMDGLDITPIENYLQN